MPESKNVTLDEYLRNEEERKKENISKMLDSPDNLAALTASKVLEIASIAKRYPGIRNITVFGPSISGSITSERGLYVLVTVDDKIFGKKAYNELLEEVKELEEKRAPRIKLLLVRSKEALFEDVSSYRPESYFSKQFSKLSPFMIASGVNLEDKDGISIEVQKELIKKFESISEYKLKVKEFEEFLRNRGLVRPFKRYYPIKVASKVVSEDYA